jgi:hypothetical protein
MTTGRRRSFSALVDADGVWLIEYVRDGAGYQIVSQTADRRWSDTPMQAFERLKALLDAQQSPRASISVALLHFGSFHHTMTLPPADDSVLAAIIRREVQRTFNLPDPVVSFTRGEALERRQQARATPSSAPARLYIGGAPRDTIDAAVAVLHAPGLDVTCLTVVPEAVRRVYLATVRETEAAAVLVCLASGPHLAFFLEGRLELSLEPPIALQTDQEFDASAVAGQLERGAVYLRQQFGGAEAKQLYLATPTAEYQPLASMLQARFGIPVHPLMPHTTPEAIIAMGAILEGESEHPVDLYPHPPTVGERFRESLRGAQGVAMGVAAAAALVAIWAIAQVVSFQRDDAEAQRLREQINRGLPMVAPIKQAVERRAALIQRVAIAEGVRSERTQLVEQLEGIARLVPPSMQFDSLNITRTKDGWATTILGDIHSSSAAEAVRALDQFYQGLAERRDVTSPSIDQFDYPATVVDTISPKVNAGVGIQFRISFHSTAGRGVR